MANLGSEVARLVRAVESKSLARADESCTRALDIVNELLAHPELKGRTEEIEILKDVIEDISSVMPKYRIKSEELESYFMPFAMRTLRV